MKKAELNFIVDSLSMVCFVFLAATGTIMYYLLPPGSGHRLAIWGWNRHDWGNIHFWVSVVFLGVMTLHLLLHWRWIVLVLKGRQRDQSGRRVAIGLISFLALLAIAIGPLISPVQQQEPSREPAAVHQEDLEEIRGSMSLAEVAEKAGIPVNTLISELGMPATVSAQDNLGRLKQEYGFTMSEVRAIIAQYAKRGE